MLEEDQSVSEEEELKGLTAKIFGFTEEEINEATAAGYDSPVVEAFDFGGMAPRISVQNEIIDSYGSVSCRSVITANGFIFAEPLSQAELDQDPPKNIIEKLIEAQDDFYSDLTSYKRFKLDITKSDEEVVQSFYNTKLNTLDFEEGSWLGWCRFTASFTSESNPTTTFIEHTESFSTSVSDGLGYIDVSDRTIATQHHMAGTYNVTARCSEVNRGMVELQDNWALDHGDTYNSGGVVYKVFVESTETSSNPTTGQISLTQNLILVHDQSNYMEAIASYSESRQRNSDSAASVLSISGEFKSLGGGTHTSQYEYFKQFADKLFSNALNSDLLDDDESLRGIEGKGTNDEWDSLGSAISKSSSLDHTTNTISYQVDYDISNYNFIVTNATKQDINISLTPQRTVYAAIPVVGRSSGPRLQNTHSVTEASKSLSLDVTFLKGCDSNSEWESIADLLSRHEPQALTNYYNQKQIFGNIESETYDPTNNTYSLTANWTYLPARLQTFAPSYGTSFYSKAPVLPSSGALATGGGWHKDEDFKDGGDTMLPRSRVFKYVDEENFEADKDDEGVQLKAVYNPISQSRFLENEGYIGEYGNLNGAVHLLNIFIHNDDQDELSTSLELFGTDAGRFSIGDAPEASYDEDWADRGTWKALYLTGDQLYPLPDSGVLGLTECKTKYEANIRSRNGPASKSQTKLRGETVNVYENIRYNLFVHKESKQPHSLELSQEIKTLYSDVFKQDFFLAYISVKQNSYDEAAKSYDVEGNTHDKGDTTFYLRNNPKGMFKIMKTGRRTAELYLRSGTVHSKWEPDEVTYDDETGEETSRTPKYIPYSVEIGAKDFSTEKVMQYTEDGYKVLDEDDKHKELLLKKWFYLYIAKPPEKYILDEFQIQPLGQINVQNEEEEEEE